MAIKIRLQKEAHPIFVQMAKEAGIGTSDLAEIACYNLIALYVNQHGKSDPDNAEVSMPVTNPASQPHYHST